MTEKDFISNWTKQISDEGIKSFPDDFISFKNYQLIDLPGKALVIGKEFFGTVEILSTDGTQVYQAENHLTAKFIIYSNRLVPLKIKIPKENSVIGSSVNLFENYLDGIIKQIESDYKKSFPMGKNSSGAINNIFRILNLMRY